MASSYFDWMREGDPPPGSASASLMSFEDEETGLMASISGRLSGSLEGASQFYDDFTIPTSTWIQFAVLLGLGLFFLFLSSLALPFIVVAPQKFASLFTLGSLFCMGAFVSLRGWSRFRKHALGTARKTTFCYVLSLVITLYFTMWSPSYFFALGAVILQLISLLYFLFSYIPGGQRILDSVFGYCGACCCPSLCGPRTRPKPRGALGNPFY
ncbi:unnamed protein product [Amoebophrya sp. A25]|nr:unnamed protein product [Amoebophrya sp. A25]|eukprot:GSA25T00001025001.1